MKIADLGDNFPKNNISSEYYDLEKSDSTKIDDLHNEIIKNLNEIQNKGNYDRGSIWAKIMRARQKIEILKVKIFVDLVTQYLDNNFSIVIFVNFTDTLKLLANTLKTQCLVYGEQNIKDRLININDFLEDKERIIICNIQCGSDSISLNDKHGTYQRVALISPPLSSLKLIQACGRICRTDSKTASFNKIIFANSDVEIKLCNKLKSKCTLYSSITDDDLNYDF